VILTPAVDENLIRSELTATQQAEHLAKRKELWGMRDLAGTSSSTKPQHQKKFAAETAEATGVSRQHINRATARAEQVSEEARDVIRARAEMRLAEEYDAAQDRGEVAGHGRSKVEADNVTTAADIGLRRDEIHDARKLRDAERDEPGLVSRKDLRCLFLCCGQRNWVGCHGNLRRGEQL